MAKKKKWIQASINKKNRGALHRDLGVAPDKPIPPGQLKSAAKSSNELRRKRAQWALNVKAAVAKRKVSSKK